MKRQTLVDKYSEDKKYVKGLDEQIREAIDERDRFAKQIGDLESLDKNKFPEAENTIQFLKLCIKVRNDAIAKWTSESEIQK